MRLAILLSECHTDFQTVLTAQQYLCPDYAEILAHIVTVICSRARGPAPVMMESWSEGGGNCDASHEEFVKSEDGEVYRLEVGNSKKVFTKPEYAPITCQGVDFLHILELLGNAGKRLTSPPAGTEKSTL